jgi:hypothetical protein
MKKRAETRQAAQGGSTVMPPGVPDLGPLVAGMTATRQSLLEWVHTVGLRALDEVFRGEAVALAGPKGRHDPGRTHHHWGRAVRDLTFGGQRLSLGARASGAPRAGKPRCRRSPPFAPAIP